MSDDPSITPIPPEYQAAGPGLWACLKLRRWAQQMAARFNGEVRLCGSVLTSETPRDIDIRIIVDDIEFLCRYKVTVDEFDRDTGQKWITDVAKLTRDVVLREKMNLDLQIMPASRSEFYTHPDRKYIVLAKP